MRYFLIITMVMSVFTACSKKESRDSQEYLLYGKWTIGSSDGDTLEFLNQDGRNILRYLDARFITGIYMEREYSYTNGVLNIQMYPTEGYTRISSFMLNQQDKEFSVKVSELYPLLSSAMTLVYKKIP